MRILIFLLMLGANLLPIEMPTIGLSVATMEDLKNEPIRGVFQKTDDDAAALDLNQYDVAVEVEHPYLFQEPRASFEGDTIVFFLSPKNEWCECYFPKEIKALVVLTPKQDAEGEIGEKIVVPVSIPIEIDKPWISRCLWELVTLAALALLIVVWFVYLKKNRPKLPDQENPEEKVDQPLNIDSGDGAETKEE